MVLKKTMLNILAQYQSNTPMVAVQMHVTLQESQKLIAKFQENMDIVKRMDGDPLQDDQVDHIASLFKSIIPEYQEPLQNLITSMLNKFEAAKGEYIGMQIGKREKQPQIENEKKYAKDLTSIFKESTQSAHKADTTPKNKPQNETGEEDAIDDPNFHP